MRVSCTPVSPVYPILLPHFERGRDSHAIESEEGVEGRDSSTLIQPLEPTAGGTFSSLSLLSSDDEDS
jgi:hypothetical protein